MQLKLMSGLYLQANYLGGVSIRDRIICARSLAKQLNKAIHKMDRVSIDVAKSRGDAVV